jgi:hypothetical protein
MAAKSDVARILSSHNYCDTELLTLEVTAQDAPFFEGERAKCIACVRERRSLPPEALRKFPRFQQRNVGQAKVEIKSGGSAATPSSTAQRNNAIHECVGKSDDAADEMDLTESSGATSSQSQSTAAELSSNSIDNDECKADAPAEIIFTAPADPFAAQPSAHEMAAFEELVSLAFRRPHALSLQGNPPPQLTHTRVEQFAVGELVVAAVQEGRGRRLTRLSGGDGGAHFTLEQAVVVRLIAADNARGAESTSGRAMVRLVQRQPMTGCSDVRCIMALCFLFKKPAEE